MTHPAHLSLQTQIQAPASVVMIRPHHFTPNSQTSADNSYQSKTLADSSTDLAIKAFKQVTQVIDTLQAHGITVHAFEDTTDKTPDSVFPNNWFSTHKNGQVAIYPMYAENRRLEKRQDIIDMLQQSYKVNDIVNYSALTRQNQFLEGTGAMVLDHSNQIAYAANSKRITKTLFQQFCAEFNYQPMLFNAVDNNGTPIYHTNVLMSVATEFVLIGDEMIASAAERLQVLDQIKRSNKKVISLTSDQIANFCGNALELTGKDARLLAISQTAFNVLTAQQKHDIEQFSQILPLDVSALEYAGGSIRCMLAGIHLSQH